MGLSIEQIYFFKDIYDEVVSSINNNIELDIRKTVQQLTSLISSEKFIPWFTYQYSSILWFKDIIAVYEMKEKFLSLKVIFPLFEELKNNKKCTLVLDELFKILYSKRDERSVEGYFENITEQYIENNKDSIENFKQSEEGKKALYNINSFFQVKGNKINELHYIYFLIFLVIYYEDLVKFLEGKTELINLNDLFKEFTEDFDDEEINLFKKI